MTDAAVCWGRRRRRGRRWGRWHAFPFLAIYATPAVPMHGLRPLCGSAYEDLPAYKYQRTTAISTGKVCRHCAAQLEVRGAA